MNTNEPNESENQSGVPDPTLSPSSPPSPEQPHRYSTDDAVPAWAVGKTADEVIDMTSNLMQTMQTFEPVFPSPVNPPPQYGNFAPAPPPVAPAPLSPPDPDLALTNAPEYQRQLEGYMNQREERLVDRLGEQLKGYMQPVTQTMGTMARAQISNDNKYSEVFDRYGHEIDQEFIKNNIPQTARTPDSYRMVAEMVQGRHWRELARDEASRLAAAGVGAGTARTTLDGVPLIDTGPQGDVLDQMWESDNDFFRSLRAQKLSKSDVREAAQRQGLPIDKWVKIVSGDDVFVAPDGKHVQIRHTHTGESNA